MRKYLVSYSGGRDAQKFIPHVVVCLVQWGNSSVFSPMLEYRFSAAGKCTVFLPHDAMGEGPNYLVQESDFVV